MRQQGVLNRIIALFALFALVLPASAKVASCLDHAKEQTCCMSLVQPMAKKLVAEQVSSCCKSKSMTSTKVQKIEESKGACHCKIKSAPTKPSNEPVIQLSGDNLEASCSTEPVVSTNTALAERLKQAIFFSDSSPPTNPVGSSHDGRAPPVF